MYVMYVCMYVYVEVVGEGCGIEPDEGVWGGGVSELRTGPCVGAHGERLGLNHRRVTHTYIHTFIHTYRSSRIHTYIHTYIHK